MMARRLLEDVQATTLGLICAMMGIVPRLVPFLVVLFAVISLVGDLTARNTRFLEVLKQPAVIVALTFAGYALLSSLWAQNMAQAAESAGLVFLMIMSCSYGAFSLARSYEHIPSERRARFLRAAPIGAAIGILFLLGEFLFDNAFLLPALQAFPELVGGSGKGLVFKDGGVVGVSGFYFNRNVAALVFLFAPLLACAWLWLKPGARLPVVSLLAVGLAVIVFSSETETAKIAVLVGAVAVGAAWLWPRQTGLGLMVVFVLLMLFAVPVGRLPHTLGLQDVNWLSYSARARIRIWDYTAEAVMDNPIVGVGAQSTRYLNARVPERVTPVAGQPSVRRFGWHTHNIYLQAWFELGAIGALLLLALGVALLRAVGFLGSDIRPWGYGLAAVTIVSAGTGWGMWQAWFLGAWVAAIFILVVADSESRVRGAGESAGSSGENAKAS